MDLSEGQLDCSEREVQGKLSIVLSDRGRYIIILVCALQICVVDVAIFSSYLWGNGVCYDAHFCYANT